MTLWLERLRPSDLHIMLPQVLLTLDQIRDQAMEPERRLATLRALKDQVEAIQSSLPGPQDRRAARGAFATSVRPLSLEQRLSRSWCGNLQRLLMELGQPRYEGNARFAVYREWTLRQLLRGQGQAIEYGLSGERPAVPGLWRSVYDLFLYLDGRDELQGPSTPGRYRFNPLTDFKRLFLLGGIGGYSGRALILEEVGTSLRAWAEESELRRGESLFSDNRALRVDVARDEPPDWGGRDMGKPYTGWLLEPPATMILYLDSIEPKVRLQTERA
ncbi:MAG: hypothetical protein ACM3ST_00435 [Bdellovibrio bacteriovorus]